MEPTDLRSVVDATLTATQQYVADSPSTLTFQWPWTIAWEGASYLDRNMPAVSGLVSGGSAVLGSAAGADVLAAVQSRPTDPAATDEVLGNGLFGPALDALKADDLLRTVLIGYSTGAQVGLMGGSGGSGVAYDILTPTARNGVSYSEFSLGVGGKFSAGLVVGAMTQPPADLNHATCVWSVGASLGVSAAFHVIMKSEDLSLVGFAVDLGGGAGIASTSGYGSISTT